MLRVSKRAVCACHIKRCAVTPIYMGQKIWSGFLLRFPKSLSRLLGFSLSSLVRFVFSHWELSSRMLTRSWFISPTCYVWTRVQTYIRTYIYMYIYTHMCACIHTRVDACLNVFCICHIVFRRCVDADMFSNDLLPHYLPFFFSLSLILYSSFLFG